MAEEGPGDWSYTLDATAVGLDGTHPGTQVLFVATNDAGDRLWVKVK